MYRTWDTSMPETIHVHAVQYPGHEERIAEPLCHSVEQLVEKFIQDNEAVFRSSAFLLFGHSLGAKIAYEVAKQLGEKGISPEALIVSGSRAPVTVEKRCLHTLSEQAFLEELRSMEGTPEAVLQNKELMTLFLPILRADFTMDETYVSTDFQVSCPLTVCYGMDDRELAEYDIEEWKRCSTGAFSIEKFNGGHFYLKTHQEEVLARLRKHLPQRLC